MKPYSLQAPEQIAKEYGGDKQKIAEAARFQLIDPTAAVLAGMFIDRVRAAEAAERQHAETVAQDVLGPKTPPAAVAGLQNAPLQPQPQQEAPLPAGTQLAQPTGVGDLPIPGSMVPTVDMGQGKAGGGLVAFASGGDVEGYADGEQIVGYRGPVFGSNMINDPVGFYAAQRKAMITPGQGEYVYQPPNTSIEGIYTAAGERTSKGLPPVDYKTIAGFFGPDRLAAKKAELEEKTGKRFSDDVAMSMIFGGLSAAGGAKQSTGSVFGDIAQALGTAGSTVGGQLIKAVESKRAAEDKLAGMDEEYAMKQFDIASKERAAALQEKQIALATGDKQAEREADERSKYWTSRMNLLVAQEQTAKTQPSQYTSAFNTRLEQLRQEAIADGINPDDPAVKARLANQASTEVRLEEAAVKVASDMTLEQVKALNESLTKARESITKEWTKVKERLFAADPSYATALSEAKTNPDAAAKVAKVEAEAMNELRNTTYQTYGINPTIAAIRSQEELDKLNSVIGGLLKGVKEASEGPKGKSGAETSGGEAFKVGDKSYKVGDKINDPKHGLIEFGGLDENGQPLWYKVEQ